MGSFSSAKVLTSWVVEGESRLLPSVVFLETAEKRRSRRMASRNGERDLLQEAILLALGCRWHEWKTLDLDEWIFRNEVGLEWEKLNSQRAIGPSSTM